MANYLIDFYPDLTYFSTLNLLYSETCIRFFFRIVSYILDIAIECSCQISDDSNVWELRKPLLQKPLRMVYSTQTVFVANVNFLLLLRRWRGGEVRVLPADAGSGGGCRETPATTPPEIE